ncbi:hypothetical protein BS50DRAFT_569087 [Corynespora cassiicola Philippines]|uniref:Uncharacterized protein n=1 Tax=Corynespora cassiicola Philippines TaxID=1448308 RepID=A0A2T2P7B0_CORCC|nr:hypothetical protein BS50DRAFT_569087 [Corynespora cassiicola Philippines]
MTRPSCRSYYAGRSARHGLSVHLTAYSSLQWAFSLGARVVYRVTLRRGWDPIQPPDMKDCMKQAARRRWQHKTPSLLTVGAVGQHDR